MSTAHTSTGVHTARYSIMYFIDSIVNPRLVWLLMMTIAAMATPQTPVDSATITGSKISAIHGLLSPRGISARQQEICPIAGGIFCNSIYCCPSNSVCQPNNPEPLACCLRTNFNCNGGTACCDSSSAQCCTESPTGCCALEPGTLPPPPPPPPPPTLSFTKTVPVTTKTTTRTSTTATVTQPDIPKATVSLNYQDMLVPTENPQTQDINVRKSAIDSLFRNICLGMQKRGTVSTLTEKFTYSRSVQITNHETACGSVSCGSGLSCDEFPFASTTDAESSTAVVANCIDDLGISIQGGFLNTLLQVENISENDHYELSLSNVDCDQLSALSVDQEATTFVSLTSELQIISASTFGPFTENDFHDHGLYRIGDLSSGTYTVNVQVTDGILDAVRIIDYQGFSYAGTNRSLGILDEPTPLIFTLTSDAVGVTLMFDHFIDYNVSASITSGTDRSGSVPSSASANPSQPSSKSIGSGFPTPSSGSGGILFDGRLHAVITGLTLALLRFV